MKTGPSNHKKTFLSAIDWRLFAVLLGLVSVGLLGLVPYGLTLSGQQFSAALIPDLLVQFLVQVILYSFLILIGMLAGNAIGLGTPLLRGWLEKGSSKPAWRSLLKPILFGLAGGILMIILDLFLFAPRLQAELQLAGETVHPPAWQGFLASFYGGITEEVLSRYFLLTVLAWLGARISRTPEGKPSPLVMWISILISGLAFGLGHLPTLSAIGITVTPLFIIRSLVLNGIGVLYGWLYWKRGLEAAMAAHFSTDLVVHVLGALLLA